MTAKQMEAEMRNKALKTALIATMLTGATMVNAHATYIDIGGEFNILNLDISDSKLDTIQFVGGTVTGLSPDPDDKISIGDGVYIADLLLEQVDPIEDTLSSGKIEKTYSFTETEYIDGFAIYDHEDNNKTLFEADLTVDFLSVNNKNGDILSELQFNLTNIDTFGDSTILNSFLTPNVGVLTLSIQFTGDISTAIANVDGNQQILASNPNTSSTFDGNITPVPEPAVTFLFSMGLAGFAGVIRKKRLQR